MAVILVVEDEEQVRVLAESIIREAGHETASAASVDEALVLLRGDQKIDLLFTELRLKDAEDGGLRLAQEAVKLRPGLPVLYASPQSETDGMRALFVERSYLLPKPYTSEQLIASLVVKFSIGPVSPSN